jgi:dTDP-4-dehydrorhamnose reductase
MSGDCWEGTAQVAHELARIDVSPADAAPPYKVTVVIVTYNRRELLEGTLRCVAAQSHPVEQIVVVDNASSDGTEAFLKTVALPNLVVHRTAKNLGGAGGFSAGLDIAYRTPSDFFWVMDDDVLFAEDTLSNLVSAASYLDAQARKPSFLMTNVFNADGEPVNSPIVDLRIAANGNMQTTRFLERGLLPVVAASFVGTLIPRAAVATYGLPIAEMFIWGDDIEYTFRLTQSGNSGYVVGDAKITHLGRGVELSLANEQDPKRAALYYYFYRNNVYNLRKFGTKQRIAGFCFQTLAMALRILRRADFAKLKILARGVSAGLVFAPRHVIPDAASPPAKVAQLGG